MTSARVDVALMMSQMTSASGKVARVTHEAYSCCCRKFQVACEPFVEADSFRRCRSKKDNSDSSGSNRIGATLMVCEAHGKICRNFDQHKMASMP